MYMFSYSLRTPDKTAILVTLHLQVEGVVVLAAAAAAGTAGAANNGIWAYHESFLHSGGGILYLWVQCGPVLAVKSTFELFRNGKPPFFGKLHVDGP